MNELRSFILDLLFPRYCIGCAEILDDLSESHLCSKCLATIPIKGDFICAFCGSQVVLGKTCPFCLATRDPAKRDAQKYYLDRLFVATTYEVPLVEKLLKTMKYDFIRSLANDAAEVMIEYLEKKVLPKLEIDSSSFLVVSVPIHRKRLNWRGFNQSEIIASKISRHFGWQFKPEVLKRIKNPTPQAEIKDRLSRIKNMDGVFECLKPEAVAGKIVVLIDDVSTTGSTLNDCARALKSPRLPFGQAGAKEVIGFVFARNR